MLVKSYLWDPTEPEVTRILMMTCWQENEMKVKGHLYFMHDAMKNVTSIFDSQQRQQAYYEYAPFGGLLTAEGDMAHENKFRFSCEYADDELGLVYYNYRHLNPADGRWINRDPIQEQGGWNFYGFVNNKSINLYDKLGLKWDSTKDIEAINLAKKIKNDPSYVVPANHACCSMIKKCAEGDCITFAAGVIRCGYLLSGDQAMADKLSKFNKDTFNANNVSKVLDTDGWKLIVYAKDSRRVLAKYTNGEPVINPTFKTGEKIAETFGTAIKQRSLYGMTVHGAVYDLDPYPIRNEGPRNVYVMPKESFSFLSATEGYHTGLYAETTVYHSPGLYETDIKGWVNIYMQPK